MQDPRNTREPRVGAGIEGLVSHSVPDLAVFSDLGALYQIGGKENTAEAIADSGIC